jgi:hypothetical protein
MSAVDWGQDPYKNEFEYIKDHKGNIVLVAFSPQAAADLAFAMNHAANMRRALEKQTAQLHKEF